MDDRTKEQEELIDRPNTTSKEWQLKVDALYSHPFFMTKSPDQKTLESNEHLKALQSLLYEGSPEEVAENFKNQGNECYRAGKAKYRDALYFYTRALEQKCSNDILNAVLYANRAVINLELGNFRTTIEDCLKSIQLQPLSVKVHYRAARAYCALDKMASAKMHIDKAIMIDPKNKALEIEKQIILDKERCLKEKQHKKEAQRTEKCTQDAQLALAIKVKFDIKNDSFNQNHGLC
jgi:tetratricopeptide (TPR) repeat protein